MGFIISRKAEVGTGFALAIAVATNLYINATSAFGAWGFLLTQ